MPWKVVGKVTERERFVKEYFRRELGMTELCRRYEISRPTGYKWVERYEEEGRGGLEDRSHVPERQWNAVSEEVENWIVEGRNQHPTWGPRKLLPWLERRHPRVRDWPALSTMGEILKRHGLVKERKRRRRASPTAKPLEVGGSPNAVWCADFKGWFRTGDGTRCDPLTISDGYSRYLLRCQGMRKVDTERVQGLFEAVFREYGLPQVIRTDNGPPFASTGVGGLSRLSVWWIKLGIVPERIQPGCPQQNGTHERLHRTLKAEAINPPARTFQGQQRAFDRFREEYNEERPHEALGQVPPGVYYHRSSRDYPRKLEEPDYPDGVVVRRVKVHGDICWEGTRIFLGENLAGEAVGLEERDARYLKIYFAHVYLGDLDRHTNRILRPRRPRRRGAPRGE